MKKNKDGFIRSLGINEKDGEKIKLLVEEAFTNAKTIGDIILFISEKNEMDIKQLFTGFLAGTMVSMALTDSGKICMPMSAPEQTLSNGIIAN